MIAVMAAAMADVRRRKLQTFIIGFVTLLASGAATLALSLLIETDAPYDHAFAQANGAHLTIVYNSRALGRVGLRGTAASPDVTTVAGPWPEVLAMYSYTAPDGGIAVQGLAIVGRSSEDTTIDRLVLESGHWVRSNGEIVVSQRLALSWGLRVGDALAPAPGKEGPELRVVGIAGSISPYTDAWVLPSQIVALNGHHPALLEQMLYRVTHSTTDSQLRAATQSITAGLPLGAVQSVGTYLDVKRNADLTAAVMVPFLLAFSAFALFAAFLIVANIVGGIVISSYRDIGIMRAVGFTPWGVVWVLLLGILAPALVGCIGGIVAGTFGSQPFLSSTASALGLPAPFTAALPVDAAVLLAILLAVVIAALAPARRAGTMSAAAAITLGSAPTATHMPAAGRLALALPVPRPVAMGLADLANRPMRACMTAGAIICGVATVIFAINLHLSLALVAEHLDRDRYAPVDVYPMAASDPGGLKGGASPAGFPAPISASRAAGIVKADPGTARYVTEGQADVSFPGISEPIPYIAYRGSSAWLGYAMISGRWFAAAGEVVVPSKVLDQGHLHIGQSVTAYRGGQPMRLKIVGEVFDQSYDNLFVRGTWSTLAATDRRLAVEEFEVQVRPGTDLAAYVNRIRRPSLEVDLARQAGSESSFLLINGVIAALAIVLTSIAIAGVFNTVLMNTREQQRDIAILKAVGMGPYAVMGMVVTSVAFVGVIGGLAGIPVGLELHRRILTFMGKIASDTNIPPGFFDPMNRLLIPLLVLCGVMIALAGAWLPAQWAASKSVSDILSRE